MATTVQRVTGLKKEDGTANPALEFRTNIVRYAGLKDGLVQETESFIISQESLESRQEEIDRHMAEGARMQSDLDAETAKLTQLWTRAAGGKVTLE